MSTTIDIENAKRIRESMEVHCGLTARSTAELSFTVSGGLYDSNISEALSNETWLMRNLADFQGEGFILDGSCELLDTSVPASLDAGKIGIRTDIGGTSTVTVTASEEIVAVTIAVTSGQGTITANGTVYTASRMVVVPVNDTSVTLTFTSTDPARRLEVASIMAGVVIEFNNTNLIRCALDLRSNLNIIEPSFEISSIEIKAYWDDDISEAVSNIGDDAPVWYYSGYDGDYSEVRNFYLSEPVEADRNVITIKAEDMSRKLEDADTVKIQRLDTTAQNGKKQLYNWMVKIIEKTGIKPVSVEDAPQASGNTTTARSLVMTEASPRNYVADIMNLGHTGTFYPVFVDAGIPVIRWTRPSPQWTINEAECGDVQRTIDRNIAKLTVQETSNYGVLNTASRASKWTAIQSNMSITKGKQITKNLQDWFWQYSVQYRQGNKFTISQLNKVQWTPSATSVKKNGKWYNRPTLYGKKLSVTVNNRSVVSDPVRSGYTAMVNPIAIGKVYQGTQFVYPNYNNLFSRSNLGGSFTWKGDPRMQPRDVFNFVHVDGTTEVCTISGIELVHENGGTVAKINYKVGNI